MVEPDGGDRQRGQREWPPAVSFHQQGQQVNGPQYNADKIEIHMSAPAEQKADHPRRPSGQPIVKSQAEIERERARRQEQEDLAYYGYRHYTRDRNQWLQTLPPEEQAAEVKRDRDRRKYGGSAARNHKQILHAGNLPADTSPADPRYVQIKHKIESARDRRQRIIAIAALTAMLALIWIAIADGAYWFVAILAIAAVVGLRTAYALYKPPVKRNGPNRLSPATNSEMMARHTPVHSKVEVVPAW
jgi:hypothetical protein